MSEDLYIRRIEKKFDTLFKEYIDGKIDSSDKEEQEVFYSRCISAITLMNLTGIDEKNIKQHITDGFNDYGIDCIYIDENSKKLFLIQSKLINNGNSCPKKGDILKFLEGIEKLLDLDFNGFNEKIKAKQKIIEDAITDVEYKIEMIIAYTGIQKIAQEIMQPILSFENKVNGGVSSLICHKIVDKSAIYNMVLNEFNNEINIDNLILSDWGMIKDEEGANAYYGVMEADKIAELWTEYNVKLLAKNIRFFKGDSIVNEGIKNILIKEPLNFIYYNNGIKIVANKVERTLKNSYDRSVGQFSLKGASIVNGAQTVGCIGEIYAKVPEKVGKAKVFVQIISLENKDENYGNQITKLSNTQNRIDSKDFATLDAEQERIRKELALENIEYAYRDGNKSINISNGFNIDEAIISMGCYDDNLEISTIVKRAIGSIYEDLNKYPYKAIFNDKLKVNLLWSSVQIMRICEEYIREQSKVQEKGRKLILIHGNRFILHMLFYKLKKEKYDLEQNIPDKKYIKTLLDYLVECIDNETKDIFAEFYPANVFKNNNKCIEIKRRICKSMGEEINYSIEDKAYTKETIQLNLFD